MFIKKSLLKTIWREALLTSFELQLLWALTDKYILPKFVPMPVDPAAVLVL
jgi:hypothetical protein